MSAAPSDHKLKENAAASKIQAAFKGHDVRKGALNMSAPKGGRGAMTLKRMDHAAMEQQMRAMEVSQWIGSTVGVKALSEAKDQNDFFKHLSDGVALCQLIEKINKSLGITYKANAKQGSFPARDNIVNFVDAAKKLGVNPVTLFDAEDLVSRKHDKQVVNCLLQLAKIAAVKYKITPPAIVQYELEIEELEQKRKAGTLKEDEDDLEEDDPLLTTSRAAAASVSGGPAPASPAGAAATATATATATAAAPASPAPADADGKSAATAAAAATDAPASPAATATASAAASPAAAPAAAEEPVKAAPAAAGAAAADAAPAKDAEADAGAAGGAAGGAGAAASGGKKGSKSDKPKYKYLPYVPSAESEIDVSVAKVLNNNVFDISVKAVEIKKKKRSRGTKHNKAEYMVAGHRVHIRKIQGVVMVHVGADWISFARFVEDIVSKTDA